MSRLTIAAGGFLLGGSLLFGQAPIEERIPITDPAELAALGFPRDDTNVYRWSKADRSSGRSLAEAAVQAPETWGTGVGYTTFLGHELRREHFSAVISRPEGSYCSSTEDYPDAQEGVAQLTVPEGAALLDLHFWAYDEDPTYGLAFNVYEFCQGAGFNPPTTTLLGSGSTVGSGGYYDGTVYLNSYKVNNRDCGYSARVIFIGPSLQCVGEKLRLLKLQASCVSQVIQSPTIATFVDVPSGHSFFQFVEALAKSGITGGCGNGNFCPDQTLTRGQMAVFLAKGLGLSWP